MHASFGTKVFLAAVSAAAVSLTLAALLWSWQVRAHQRDAIARRLTDEARLIAELLSAAPGLKGPALDLEADRLGLHSASRVTLIAEDGRVVGDSTQTVAALPALENHLDRPEVLAARDRGLGINQRYSTTVSTDFLYVTVRAAHPAVSYVRLALPLTDIDGQLAAIRRLTLIALAAAIPVALLIAWAFSAPIGRRVQEMASMARRSASQALPATSADADELGAVARVLDASSQELARRLEELSRDHARSDAILTAMEEGVLVVDRDGRLQLVNRAAREMLGIGDAAIGRPYLEAIRHPDISSQLTGALQGESVAARELSLARHPERTFVARAATVAGSGGGGGVLVLHEVTDLRRTDRIRRDFVANVSHELRTPLTAIRGYLEALGEETASPRDRQQFLDVLSRHTTRMERLVTDLLQLARLDARQEVLDRAPCDVAELCRAVVADFAPSIRERRQRVEIDGEGHAIADASRLHDVIRNLLDNAVSYSPEGADIQLEVRRDESACTLRVMDSGPGIPPADLRRVFERFYRVDPARSRAGTGLGLAIVKHLVELHGGAVTAANRPSGGAVFTVTLPDAPARPNVTQT